MILIQDVSTKGISESTNFYVESRLRGFLVQMRDISKVKKSRPIGAAEHGGDAICNGSHSATGELAAAPHRQVVRMGLTRT
jgi:hypothetical protein